jgi:hypothetical protein
LDTGHETGSGQGIGIGADEPAVREALGLRGPGHVVIAMHGGTLTMRTMAQALEEVCALARPYAPNDGLASEELIAERRVENLTRRSPTTESDFGETPSQRGGMLGVHRAQGKA